MDRPLVYLTISFALGIALQKLIGIPLCFCFSGLVTLLILSIYTYLKRINLSWLLLILAFFTGVVAYQIKITTSPGDISSFSNKSYQTVIGKVAEGPMEKLTITMRKRFNEVLLKILPQKEAALLGSILLGTAVSPIPEETKDYYRKAGLIHLLVVSGTQVSILMGLCLAISRIMNLPLPLAVFITSFFNLMLTIITGAGPSILRAAIMGEITILGLLFEREKDFYTSLALSAFIILILNPLNLFDIGFQLSFVATWALVYVAPVLKECLFSKFPSIFSNLLAVSLAPVLATTPIIAFNFGQISLGAVFSNLAVLAGMEILVIFGFLTTILGLVFLPLAKVLGGTLWLMLFSLDGVAQFISSLPGLSFYIKTPTFPLIIGYYLGLITLMEILHREKKLSFSPKRLTMAILLVVSVLIWHTAVSADLPWRKELAITFLNVGEGDSILIETPNDKKVLIDGGGEERRELIPFLRRKGINKLDLVILTHPHEDHVGGLNSVLEKIKVDQVLDSGQVYESFAYRRFLALINANAIKYTQAFAGQVIDFGENIKGWILNPSFPLLQDTNSDLNNNSIVMKLVYGDISFLFAGDLEKEGEDRILQYPLNATRSTILKVGHHGSSTSTSDEFLKAVNPRFGVISVGRRNRYWHPHPSLLERLRKFGVKIYRTDENGTITIKTDGKSFSILPQK